MAKYISTVATFVDGSLYPAGAEFELPEGMKPSAGMTLVDGDAPKKVGRPPKKGPETFSEIAKQDADKVA